MDEIGWVPKVFDGKKDVLLLHMLSNTAYTASKKAAAANFGPKENARVVRVKVTEIPNE